jgi:glutathione S-transferase
LVPCLVDGDKVLYESAIVNEYLDEAYPDVPLMPKDVYSRAQVRIWTDYISNKLAPAGRAARSAETAEAKAEARKTVEERLAYLERHLSSGESPWFVGGSFTLADANAVPFVERVALLEDSPLPAYPAVAAWYDAVKSRASYQATAD